MNHRVGNFPTRQITRGAMKIDKPLLYNNIATGLMKLTGIYSWYVCILGLVWTNLSGTEVSISRKYLRLNESCMKGVKLRKESELQGQNFLTYMGTR